MLLQADQLDIVRVLVEGGAHISRPCEGGISTLADCAGLTPLMICTRQGYSSMLAYLLSKGADATIQASPAHKNWLPLHFSIDTDRQGVICMCGAGTLGLTAFLPVLTRRGPCSALKGHPCLHAGLAPHN